MKIVVDFCYTSSITITEENVWGVLPAANFFQIQELCLLCADFLRARLSSDTCLRQYLIGLRFGLSELTGDVLSFLKDHLKDVSHWFECRFILRLSYLKTLSITMIFTVNPRMICTFFV